MKTLLTIIILAMLAYIGVWTYRHQISAGYNEASVISAERGSQQLETIGVAASIGTPTLSKYTTETQLTAGLDAQFKVKIVAKKSLRLPVKAHIDLVMMGTTTPIVVATQLVTGSIINEKTKMRDIPAAKAASVSFNTRFETTSLFMGLPYKAVLRKIDVVSPRGVIAMQPMSTNILNTEQVVLPPRTTSVNLSKISSTVTTTKYNNRDTGVVSTVRLNLTAVKGDVSAISGLTAEISLKNLATGEVIATKTVNGASESGLQVFSEGAIKEVSFTALFSASSSLPVGVTNISSVVNKITYKPINTGVVQTVTSGMSQFNSEGYTTFTQ